MVREFVFLGLSEFRIRDYGLGFGVIDFFYKKFRVEGLWF